MQTHMYALRLKYIFKTFQTTQPTPIEQMVDIFSIDMEVVI